MQNAANELSHEKKKLEAAKNATAQVENKKKKCNAPQQMVVHAKFPIDLTELAEIMGLKVHELIKEMLKQKIYTCLDQTIELRVAAKLARERHFIEKCRDSFQDNLQLFEKELHHFAQNYSFTHIAIHDRSVLFFEAFRCHYKKESGVDS